MDSWQRFNETSLSKKKEFGTNLTIKTLQMMTKNMQKDFGKILE